MSETWSPPQDRADVERVLELLERRRLAIDQVMWQNPALVVTAQAFLFVVVFNASTPNWGRLVVMGAGLFAVVAAWQSLAKQRYLEVIHSEAIMLCLDKLGLPGIYRDGLGPLWAKRLAVREPSITQHVLDPARLGETSYRRLVVDLPSFELWLLAFLAFALTDLGVIVVTSVHLAGG
jgi:hypothetical protein